MGWYAFVSLISDGRIKFLLGFVIVAIIVASVLIFIEIRLKKKNEIEYINTIDKSIIEKINKFLKKNKTPKEKLDFIDKSAKEYFKEAYGIPLNSDYSKLINEFGKRNKKDETVFCKKMFSAYYLHKKINSNEVIDFGNLLIDIIKKEEKMYLKYYTSSSAKKDKAFYIKRKNILPKEKNSVFNMKTLGWKIFSPFNNKMNSFWERIGNFFENRKRIAIEKKRSNIERIRIGKRENYKATRKNAEEIINWVKKTIEVGYDREYVFNLLNDGNRKKEEINNILNIYDDEMSKISNNNENIKEKIIIDGKKGIAEKIVKMEKSRLNNVGLYTTKF